MAIQPDESLNYERENRDSTATRTKNSSAEVLKSQYENAHPPAGSGESKKGTMPTIILINVLMIATILIGVGYLFFNGTSSRDTGAAHEVDGDSPKVLRTGQPPAEISVRQFGRRAPSVPSETLERTNQTIEGGNSSNAPRRRDPINQSGVLPTVSSPAEHHSGL